MRKIQTADADLKAIHQINFIENLNQTTDSFIEEAKF